MAPAVPFALLGAVQLTAVAGWLGLAGAAVFPRLRRRVTPLFVLGALALAVADAYTAVRFGPGGSDAVAWLRVAGLALLAAGAVRGVPQSLVLPTPGGLASGAAGVVVPLGAAPTPAVAGLVAGVVAGAAAGWRGRGTTADRALGLILGAGFVVTGVAAALAAPARTSYAAAVAVLACRGAATLLVAVALVLLARTLLVGKIVGAILAGVVAMAVGAVAVVGTSVASEVQSEQSSRLLQVAQSEQAGLATLATRATLFAQIVGECPNRSMHEDCINFLRLFSDQPDYFAAIVRPGKGAALVAPNRTALSNAALVQLAGSPVVQAALQPSTNAQSAPTGPLLLTGSPPRLAVVAAVPGRPNGSTDARVKPTFASVYGVGIVDSYLQTIQRLTKYDLSIVADGHVIASSLPPQARGSVLREAASAHVEDADPSVERVVSAQSDEPTVAFVPITEAGNDDVRIATLALSQPANVALSAQRGVLRRLFLTALIALVVVALLAIALAQRIAEPVRRLTIAAGRVRRGDLEARTTIGSRDEVGRLSRAFDAMTESLRRLTSDLRDTAEQESRLRARLETVVASMSDGLVVVDGSSRITAVNPTAGRLLGLTGDEALGRPLAEVVRVEDRQGRSLLARANGRTVEGDLVCTGAKTRVPVRVGVAALGNGQGQVIVLADRSREEEVERMKTEFLANISHELRTPLTPIRGYAELLSRRADLPRPQVETFLEEILSSTGRMSRAVELLVDVAALEGGRIEPQTTTVTVRSFVDERVESWKARYPERAGDFKRRIAAKLPAVDVDRHWVTRALDEFADNAVKYTPPRTAITLVATCTEDGAVRLALRDNGPGFEAQRAAELMGDFSQADASETRRVGGLGLGLGFVRRVSDRFGLGFTAATEPGKGSEFALVLPVASDR